jgi:hypothetical protein
LPTTFSPIVGPAGDDGDDHDDGGLVTEYEAVFQAADHEAADGHYKEAYNTLARALTIGGPDDQRCRYQRGVYAFRVADSRLEEFRQSPTPKLTLIKAGCWLSRSEAYLLSAGEDAGEAERRRVESDLERTREKQDLFRELCREFGTDLFMSKDEDVGAD